MSAREDLVDLSQVVTVQVTTGKPIFLTKLGFIEGMLRMLYGPRAHDERLAFEMLGGHGFAANRSARRRRLWAEAEEIAARVGHGEEVEPMIFPNFVYEPITKVSEVKRLFETKILIDKNVTAY